MSDLHTAGFQTPDDHHSPVDRAELHSLLPAFALDATDPEEAAFVRQHLAADADAAAELARYQRLVTALQHSAAPVTPPATLETELLHRLATTAPTRRTPAASGQAWHWPQRARWLAAAGALLLLLAGLWLAIQLDALRVRKGELQAQVTRQEAALAAQQVQLAAQQQALERQQQENAALQNQDIAQRATIASQLDLMAAVVAAAGESYLMHPAQEGSRALATVAWLEQPGVGVLRADNFPPLSAEMTYQLWLIKDGERTSGGLFTVDAGGRGSLVFTPPAPLEEFDGMGVTPEPAGGSRGPTAPPVVTATLEHS